MKALNRKDIIRTYCKFAEYMMYLVVTTLFCVHFFLKTSRVEINQIKQVSKESGHIYNEQITISEKLTDIFNTYRSLETSPNANPDFFMNSIASKKMEISNIINELPQKDVQLHKLILSQMDEFLRTRDSISGLRRIEEVIKNDVIRCNEENKNITRRLSVGRLSYDRR
ncbi:hypothetical protein HQ47_04210 [Porphyromonas macacae]|uniref:Type VI secretion system transmembrane protein TssQ n=1 Tax=Porphyromonas macacae TaxID=28115 RepID=A0A0A2E880_9PORP|nr:type VI secretion system TssO [Porphyromonas macacae]KGN75108.1 hypothetical protein HQ47_04210 [Porphyromonas macacae]